MSMKLRWKEVALRSTLSGRQIKIILAALVSPLFICQADRMIPAPSKCEVGMLCARHGTSSPNMQMKKWNGGKCTKSHGAWTTPLLYLLTSRTSTKSTLFVSRSANPILNVKVTTTSTSNDTQSFQLITAQTISSAFEAARSAVSE